MTTFAGHFLGPGTHAARPAAAGLPEGTMYVCTTDAKIERVVSGAWADYATLGGAGGGVTVASYVERTTDYSLTGSAAQVITAAALTYTAALTKFEFWVPVFTPSAGGSAIVELHDGATQICRLGACAGSATTDQFPLYFCRYLTPSAASHTYNVKAWSGAGSNVFTCGNGASGQYPPIFFRITTGG